MNEPTPYRAPVIADVAAAAGVSVPTVSRVLNGSARVSEPRRRRVLNAVAELGYAPNSAARALVSGRRTGIGVIARETTNYGYAATLQGIEDAARSAGYSLNITIVESDSPAAVSSVVDLVSAQSLAGIVVIEFDSAGSAALERLPEGLPKVSVGRGGPPTDLLPRAYIDDRSGAKQSVDYLLSLGHANVHYVAIPSGGQVDGRLEGWRGALEDAGILDHHVSHAKWGPKSGYEIGIRLADDPRTTAILCGNDELAIGVMRALFDRGVRIPQDVSVMGFDDHPLARYWAPSLTTVAQDFVDLGRRAVDLLVERITTDRVKLASTAVPQLILRESTGVPPKP